jgi:signal transduction histidine kinase
MRRASDSPIPHPRSFVVYPASKIRRRSSRGTPGPSSATRIAGYFRARVPSRAHAVTVEAMVPPEPIVVEGDAVLLEWVLESLVKNAVDALAGRGGRIEICAERLADGRARVRVSDDGPGVPREDRRRIFDAGYTTKERGWGIGLSLARRIVEENHGGRLTLAPVERGAAFDVILR